MDREKFSRDEEILMDTRQAAEVLKISPKTLERMRVEGRGPAFAKIGRCVRYRKSDVLDFIERNVFESTSEFAENR